MKLDVAEGGKRHKVKLRFPYTQLSSSSSRTMNEWVELSSIQGSAGSNSAAGMDLRNHSESTLNSRSQFHYHSYSKTVDSSASNEIELNQFIVERWPNS